MARDYREQISRLGDDFDGYAAARSWYSYSCEPLPPWDPKRPGATVKVTDRRQQRTPNQQRIPKMTTALTRTASKLTCRKFMRAA